MRFGLERWLERKNHDCEWDFLYLRSFCQDLTGAIASAAALLGLDWRKRQSTQAKVRDTIKDVLDLGLPRAYESLLSRLHSLTRFSLVLVALLSRARSFSARVLCVEWIM